MLRAEATDADGDALTYEWRVTGGTVENRNAAETVWTLPDGPGLHFAYLLVSDGKGGHVQRQYAVSTDALETSAALPPARGLAQPKIDGAETPTARLRLVSPDSLGFAVPSSTTRAERTVYLPDVQVEVVQGDAGPQVFAGTTDLGGEVDLPPLLPGQNYTVRCTTSQDAPMRACASFTMQDQAMLRQLSVTLPTSQNLRLYGHVALADGSVCAQDTEFFGTQSAATVQLRQADGVALTKKIRVNRFGDYAIDAAVPVHGALRLAVQCGSHTVELDVPASSDLRGYIAEVPVELSHVIPNSAPRVVRVVANGPEGSIRGREVVPLPSADSNELPGELHFLTAKGRDTQRSACMYYRAFGAVRDCDEQGKMVEPITLDDWKRLKKFSPYQSSNSEVGADYINGRDLNLVRRMTATQVAADDIAFYVCNHPGPERFTQQEIDELIARGRRSERLVACVAMEWSVTPGANGDRPFTKFLTFAPDGSLLPSVNLDGRGEKFMPGACVACHGGTQYNGRFPERGNPSPYLGARFLGFDTANFYFSTDLALTETAQADALHRLNELVRLTESVPDSPTSKLIQGWYALGSRVLDKSYVPPAWRGSPDEIRFYRDVVATSCRTCHVALGPRFDWDASGPAPLLSRAHVCGGSADLAVNATMPNALVSHDRLHDAVRADPTLAELMRRFLGCDRPLPDPAFPRR